MQTDEFIARVQEAGADPAPESARAATLATLEVLCEQLSAEEARRLAAQLPDRLGEAAETGGGRQRADRREMTLPEFHHEIASRADIAPGDAAVYAAAVTRTLRRAVTDGEITDVALELPPQLADLLAW